MTADRNRLAAAAGGHGMAIGVDQRLVLCTCGWRNQSDDNLTRPVRNWSLHVADALLPVVQAIVAEGAAAELDRMAEVLARALNRGPALRCRNRAKALREAAT